MGSNAESSPSKLSDRKKDALAQAGRRKLEEFRQRKRAAVACTGTGGSGMQQPRDRVCRQASLPERLAVHQHRTRKDGGPAEQTCDGCWNVGDSGAQDSILLSRSSSAATSASSSSFDHEGSCDLSTSQSGPSEGKAGFVRIAGAASVSVRRNGSMLVWLQALVECWPHSDFQVAGEPLASHRVVQHELLRRERWNGEDVLEHMDTLWSNGLT
ncbi:hypothetical protein CLOM_g11523 [Closterium sp. NIES-68]|nr:hypothetical protein CLOM_g5029 [Closterium sp. NIES-68]GJP52401.1 hypothetical protein CLOM_g11523 [Closterium sp. NIES-68]GJP67790.1 hypothetical protein CLOP_g24561 [Closterium sp. NIES-67]